MNSTDRFFKYAHYKKLNISQLERECGFSKGYLGKQKLQGSDMGTKKIAAIKAICPDLNLDWLVTGLGEMMVRGEMASKMLMEELKKNLDERAKIIQLQFDALESKNTEIKKLKNTIARLREKPAKV